VRLKVDTVQVVGSMIHRSEPPLEIGERNTDGWSQETADNRRHGAGIGDARYYPWTLGWLLRCM